MWPFEYKYNVQCFWLKRILNIIIQAGIFREYRNKCFWRPKAQVGIFREYRNKCFWRPKCFGKGTTSVYAVTEIKWPFLDSIEISASEDLNALEKAPPQIMPLRILSGKGAVQIMPFWKLGGKCHFLLRFCMRKRSETILFSSPAPNVTARLGTYFVHGTGSS